MEETSMEREKQTTMEREDLIDLLIHKGNGVKGFSQLNLPKIPDQFIQPPQHRLNHIQITTQESVPIIDVSNWEDPKLSESICVAATKLGLFQIVNHGIPVEVVEKVKRAAHDFFELPVEERRKYLKKNSPSPTVCLNSRFSPLKEEVLEWKDFLYHVADPNNLVEDSEFWPSVSRDPVLEYLNFARPIIKKLLQVLLRGINVKQIDEVKESSLMGYLGLNLLYYPVCPNPELAAGARPHSDISSITILLQDDVGGLYVRATEGDAWIHVTPTKGSLVVSIGDVLQIMSNGRYTSNEHRVFLISNKNRVSIPVFAKPSKDSVLGPLLEVLEGGEKPIYKEVVFSDYVKYFFSKGQDSKQAIDYAKI